MHPVGTRIACAGTTRDQPELATWPRYRFPAGIIGQVVWLCHACGLGLRGVELILAGRGIGITREGIRQWCRRFGTGLARRSGRRGPRPGGTWHLDQVIPKTKVGLHRL